jgi:hypothetical protein
VGVVGSCVEASREHQHAENRRKVGWDSHSNFDTLASDTLGVQLVDTLRQDSARLFSMAHLTYSRDMCRLGVGEAWITRRNLLRKDRPVLKLVDIKVTRVHQLHGARECADRLDPNNTVGLQDIGDVLACRSELCELLCGDILECSNTPSIQRGTKRLGSSHSRTGMPQ